MSPDESNPPHELISVLRSLRRWMRALTLAVVLMALALFLTVATVFGYLVDYHGGEPLLWGAASVAVAVLGFGFGLLAAWLLGRR